MDLGEMMLSLWESTGFASSTWQNYVMLLISFVLFYLAIARKFEPLLLVPIAFGMLLANIPGAHDVLYESPLTTYTEVLDDNGALLGYEATYVRTGGLFYYLSKGVEWVIFPPLIFLGIGAMTDFGPLIANPKSLLLGAGAQLGIFVALALGFLAFDSAALAASVAIIGGRTYRYICHDGAGADGFAGCDSHSGIFVYGSHSGNTAADHEIADDQGRAPHKDEAASQRIAYGKNSFPYSRHRTVRFIVAVGYTSSRNADARQPSERVSRDGQTGADGKQRAVQRHYHTSRIMRRFQSVRRGIP